MRQKRFREEESVAIRREQPAGVSVADDGGLSPVARWLQCFHQCWAQLIKPIDHHIRVH
jgi:hypothetical protein